MQKVRFTCVRKVAWAPTSHSVLAAVEVALVRDYISIGRYRHILTARRPGTGQAPCWIQLLVLLGVFTVCVCVCVCDGCRQVNLCGVNVNVEGTTTHDATGFEF